MKRFVVYPDYMLEDMIQVVNRKEPFYLHSVLWIICGIFLGILCFICFGKMDEAVRADGVVRPEKNVSIVYNVISGEIEDLFYKPGDYVYAGDKLLCIKGEGLCAQKNNIEILLEENREKTSGLKLILSGYECSSEKILCKDETITARYEAFVAERKLLKAVSERAEKLLKEEIILPESSTTESEIESKRYDYSVSRMEYERFCADFYSSIKQEINALILEREDFLKQKTQIEETMNNLMIVSPVEGYVFEKSSLNKGDYIFADQQVLNIVPDAEKACRIELQVAACDMGKLKPGQKVKLRFPAFPYSEFKGLEGVLSVIQPDSEFSENSGLFFTVYAVTDKMELHDRKGIAYQIKPGFEVNARIVLENQSLMYFLLKKLNFTV